MRTEWTIQMTAEQLARAAQNRQKYHEGRADWWTKEQLSAEQTLREKGIDIREYQQTGGARMQAILDPDLANRLAECQSKVKTHSAKDDEFTAWEDFFGAMPSNRTLDVHQADFAYFDIAGDGDGSS